MMRTSIPRINKEYLDIATQVITDRGEDSREARNCLNSQVYQQAHDFEKEAIGEE